MTLLLKALKKTKIERPASRGAKSVRDRWNSTPSAPHSSPIDYLEVLQSQDSNLWEASATSTALDPAKFISGATAVIEPFEPFESTATEFLAADALPECLLDDEDEFDCVVDTEIDLEDEADFAIGKTNAATPRDERQESDLVDQCELIVAEEVEPAQNDFIPAALLRLEQLQRLISLDRENAPASGDAMAPPDVPSRPTQVAPLEAKAVQRLPLRVEFRELRDHLLAKFPIQKPCTLLLVDAGRSTCDASWLVPLAVSIVQHVEETGGRTPKILLVEAAGSDAGIVRGLGLESSIGLNQALIDSGKLAAAIVPTEHAQIFLLTGGDSIFSTASGQSLSQLWPNLQQQFDLVLVQAGSMTSDTATSKQRPFAATDFLPIADGVILSVELDGTPRLLAEEARRRLVAKGAKILGCVVHGGETA